MLSGRQAVGILVAFCLLMCGRLVRHHMLVTVDGQWREHMWLDEIVLPAAASESSKKPSKPVLTSPLPINTCSVDSLTLLPGVGPVLAARIQEMRTQGFIFAQKEDLKEVKGIGPALSDRLAPLVIYTVKSAPDSLAEDSP